MSLDPSSASSYPSLSARAVTGADIARWMRHLLARNPFYVISAALLLLSMRLLSGDARVFKGEESQLLFNFSSFQIYELLLVGTAILLARRRIWYDAGLLIGVETLFVFVPFILVSQALLLENKIALAFCLSGCALAAFRVHSLKRWLAGLNMPAAMLWMGAALLALNLICPILTRHLHQNLSVPMWDARGAVLKSWEWNLILPLAMSLALFLPASMRVESSEHPDNAAFFTRRSFPLLAWTLWMAGTAAHVFCVGYVYGLPWAWSLLAPMLWAGAWILWMRRSDLDFVPAKFNGAVNALLFAGPVAAALFSAWADDWKKCCWLALLNLPIYGALAAIKRDRRALHLGLISAVVALAAVPHHFLRPVGIQPAHVSALWMGLAGYLILLAMWSRSPKWGILGGLGFAGTVIFAAPHTASGEYLAIQLGLVFIILHSLRWMDALYPMAKQIRKLVVTLWLAHGFIWMIADIGAAALGTFLLGLSVVAIYFCARVIMGRWAPRIVAYSALALMAFAPIWQTAARIPETPTGVLLLIGSFALFALGTAAAMTKARWYGNGAPPPRLV